MHIINGLIDPNAFMQVAHIDQELVDESIDPRRPPDHLEAARVLAASNPFTEKVTLQLLLAFTAILAFVIAKRSAGVLHGVAWVDAMLTNGFKQVSFEQIR